MSYFSGENTEKKDKTLLEENLPHYIAVCVSDSWDMGVFLSAVVFWLKDNSNTVSLYEMTVDISMRNIGVELISDDKTRTEETLNTLEKMSKYELQAALENSSVIPNELPLLLTVKNTYCGRICFYKRSLNSDNIKSDSAVFIIRSKEDTKNILDFLSEERNNGIPIVFAVVSQQVYSSDDGAEKKLFEYIPELGEKLKGRTYISFWYNPYGFTGKNELRASEDPSPIGIESIFWKSVEYAAENRSRQDSQTVEECQNVIASRRSIYQRTSVRRQLQLNKARRDYARSVVRLYSSENLLALCKGILTVNTDPENNN